MVQRKHTDFLKSTLADACREAEGGNVAGGRAYLAAGLGIVQRTLPASEEKRQLLRLWQGVIARFTERFGVEDGPPASVRPASAAAASPSRSSSPPSA